MPTCHHIRYAKANRFEEPELMPFEEPCSYDSAPVICPQDDCRFDFIMGPREEAILDEDCLFLTIHTPSRDGRRPVLVWIHGGAYIIGSGEEAAYDGSALSEEGDIVVVTISYRLGVFGYLYEEQGQPQNLGLKDQMTALRWVHENISQFGGDPQQVTLAGQSAGAHSVASLISYCKEPYFQKAILQSGPLGFSYSKRYLKKQYRRFLKLIGKPAAEATTEEMLIAQKRLMDSSLKAMCYGPYAPELGKGSVPDSLKKVLVSWQKDDTSPFVAIVLKHENNYGGLFDRIATKISSWIVFKRVNKKYASYLKHNGIEVQMHEFDWRPKGSVFGACHCLELCLLFGSWERWKGSGMLGDVNEAEWKSRSQELRRQWLEFIR